MKDLLHLLALALFQTHKTFIQLQNTKMILMKPESFG